MPTLPELRQEIDRLDQKIIDLLAQRTRIVEQVGELKTSDDEVVALDRQKEVYATRRQWATEHGVDPELVESLYRRMIEHFIEHERKQLEQRNNKP